ncbi:MAG: glycoside hydrolase [Muribaculaceae bacterium]|nr:glycoside hydrolase [Muribaculaceae bacterium]
MKPRAHIFATFLIAASIVSTAGAEASVDCAPSSPAVLTRSLVYSGPDSISKFYRIPALAVAPDGAIVAVADRRLDTNRDLPSRIDVVARRSTDGGRTWSPVIEVAVHDSVGGYGDPGLGVNKKGDLVVVMTHGNGLWESTPDNHGTIYTTRSTDGGLSWSEPVDITAGLFASDGTGPVQAVTAFATSGHIETLRDGTMMFALVTRPNEKKWSELEIYPVRSTDGGRSWKIIPVAVDADADESKIVQAADGSLLMSIRNRRKGYRKFARSTDRGRSWTPVEKSTTLPDPACNGDVISYRHRGHNYLLHTVPDSHTDRRDVSLFASADNGATWRKLITLCPAWSVYSAIAELPDGTLGCLTEEGNTDGGLRIWFTRLDVGSLLDKQFGE